MCEEGRDRDFKTKIEHWEIVVNFLEEYPQLLRSKFKKMDGDSKEIKGLWEQLVQQLNSLGYGRKPVEKWQLAVGRWKSKVKAKASQLRVEIEKTGGGPAKSPPLTELEERLMSLLGWRAVRGDGNKEIGIDMPKTDTVQVEQKHGMYLTEISDIISASQSQPSTSSGPPPLHCLSSGTRKMVSLHQMRCENLAVLKSIDKNTKILGDALTDMRNDFQDYMNFLKEQ